MSEFIQKQELKIPPTNLNVILSATTGKASARFLKDHAKPAAKQLSK